MPLKPFIFAGEETRTRVTSPTNGLFVTTLTPTITWVGYGAQFDVEIARTLTGTPTAEAVSGLTYTVEDDLTLGDDPYFVRVRPVGKAWSRPVLFYVTPLVLPELSLWLDRNYGVYQDSAGTIPATLLGDPVGCWKTRGGSVLSAVQTVTGLKPVVGIDGITFDGVDDALAIANNDIIKRANVKHIYAVFKPNATNGGVFSRGGDNSYRVWWQSGTVGGTGWDSGDRGVTTPTNVKLCAQLWRVSNTSIHLRAGGVQNDSTQPLFIFGENTATLDLGYGNGYFGNVALDSLFLFTETPADKTAFDAYITAKGVTV